MLKCTICSDRVYRKYLLICEKCDLCYHLLCVKPPGENKSFVCESCESTGNEFTGCGEKLTHLISNIGNIDATICNLRAIKENQNDLVNLSNTLQTARRDIDCESGQLKRCIEEIKELGKDNVNDDLESLSNTAKNANEELEILNECTIKLLAHADLCKEELPKLQDELQQFEQWFESTKVAIRDNKDDVEGLATEVTNQGKTLQTVLLSVQKLDIEKKGYLQRLNNFRRTKALEKIDEEPEDSELRKTVTFVTNEYNKILQEVNERSDWASDGRGLRESYGESVNRAQKWLDEIEPKVEENVMEPIGEESSFIEKQVEDGLMLKEELIGNRGLIDDAKQATTTLLKTYQHLSSEESTKLEAPVKALENNYHNLQDALSKKHQEVFQAFAQAQSLETTLENLNVWINSTEQRCNQDLKQASLVEDVLNKQLADQRVLISEIETHLSSIQMVEITNGAKNIERFSGIEARAKELLGKVKQQEVFLEDVKDCLRSFNEESECLLQWCDVVVDGLSDDLVEISCTVAEKDVKQKLFDKIITTGNSLVNRENVTDTNDVKDSVDGLGKQWAEVGNTLNEKLRKTREDAEALQDFERSTTAITSVLGKLHCEIDKIVPTTDLVLLGEQLENMQLIKQEYESVGCSVKDFYQKFGGTYDTDGVTNQYKELGIELNNKSTVLTTTEKVLCNIRNINDFLDNMVSHFIKGKTLEDIVQYLSELNDCLLNFSMMQPLLDETKYLIDANQLPISLEATLTKWESVNNTIKVRKVLMETLKEFTTIHCILNTWLSEKEPVVSEVILGSEQNKNHEERFGQLILAQSEFKSFEAQIVRLDEIINTLPEDPDMEQYKELHQTLHQRWLDFSIKLKDCIDSIGSVLDNSKQFETQYTCLKEDFEKLSTSIDQASQNTIIEDHINNLGNLERQLDGQRSLLTDLSVIASSLCQDLDDQVSIAGVQSKVAQLGKQYEGLQKKLDFKKAQSEDLLKESQQFKVACSNTLGWLLVELEKLPELFLISADRSKLEQQVKDHDAIYKRNLEKEHEIVMLLEKGRTTDNNNNPEVDRIQSNWDKLRKDCVERQSKLFACKRNCDEFYQSLENFVVWLTDFETELSLLTSVDQTKTIADRLHCGEDFSESLALKVKDFNSVVSLSQKFLASCDVDKEVVATEVRRLEGRWEIINTSLQGHLQELHEHSNLIQSMQEKINVARNDLDNCQKQFNRYEADVNNKSLLSTVDGDLTKLQAGLPTLNKSCRKLVKKLNKKGTDVHTTITELIDDAKELAKKVEARKLQLKKDSDVQKRLQDKLDNYTTQLSHLKTEFDDIKMPSLSKQEAQNYLDQVGGILENVDKLAINVDQLATKIDQLATKVNQQKTQNSDLIKPLRSDVGKLQKRAQQTRTNWNGLFDLLTELNGTYFCLLDDLQKIDGEVHGLAFDTSTIATIESAKDNLRKYEEDKLKPLEASVEEFHRLGEDVVELAPKECDSKEVMKRMEDVGEIFKGLSKKIATNNKELDMALVQHGLLQQVLNNLNSWLDNFDATLTAQTPPSMDYKVVKEQIKVQEKLKLQLEDKLKSLVNWQDTSPISGTINERIKILVENVEKRYLDLGTLLPMVKEFYVKTCAVTEWMGTTETTINLMDAQAGKDIDECLRVCNSVLDETVDKRKEFDDVNAVASKLRALLVESEQIRLQDRLGDLTNKYEGISKSCTDKISTLTTLKDNLLKLQNFNKWLQLTESKIKQFDDYPINESELEQYVLDLKEISDDISSHDCEFQELTVIKDPPDSNHKDKYNQLKTRTITLLTTAENALTLVHDLNEHHKQLTDWLDEVEPLLKTAKIDDREVIKLEIELEEYNPIVDLITTIAGKLTRSNSELLKTVASDIERYESVKSQILKRSKVVEHNKIKVTKVVDEVDDLLDWFRNKEHEIKDSGRPSSDPFMIAAELKSHKELNNNINLKRGESKDVVNKVKEILRENQPTDEMALIKEKVEDLRDTMSSVAIKSSDKLDVLEQAYHLAEHFYDTHNILDTSLDDIEEQAALFSSATLTPDLIAQQQDQNDNLLRSANEYASLIEKLNKNGEVLLQICHQDEETRIMELLNTDNARYSNIKSELRNQQQQLEKALQDSSQLTDKLEGMLRVLTNTQGQVDNYDQISVHVPKIRKQISENHVIIDDLDKRKEAYENVKKAAGDVIAKAGNDDNNSAIKDMQNKMISLELLWDNIIKATSDRGQSLEEALKIAEQFWTELDAIKSSIKSIEDTLLSQEPPSAQVASIQKQQHQLNEIKENIEKNKPHLEKLKSTGEKLIDVCGESEIPEVKKQLAEVDDNWENITAQFLKQEKNLIKAMERAMQFQETITDIKEFLDKAEDKFANVDTHFADVNDVKKQIETVNEFKKEMEPHVIKIESLNRQAQDLSEILPTDHSTVVEKPVEEIRSRLNALQDGIATRQGNLDKALLELGDFDLAFNELLSWLLKTKSCLDEINIVVGDVENLEESVVKVHLLIKDIKVHNVNVNNVKEVGKQLADKTTEDKLNNLHLNWTQLNQTATEKLNDLETTLSKAIHFNTDIQDELKWLEDVAVSPVFRKPIGGLQETASEQLENFMETYNEIESHRSKIESLLAQGENDLANGSTSVILQIGIASLKQQWNQILVRANDKKIKLEIALNEANKFQDAFKDFADWLTSAEDTLKHLQPVSRVWSVVQEQMQAHKTFQKNIATHRATMYNLDKKGTYLKYFTQREDATLIQNLLVSLQHRWDRVNFKTQERTMDLELAYKEGKEFYDAWSTLWNWLNETEEKLDKMLSGQLENDSQKIKVQMVKYEDLLRSIGSKQKAFDKVIRIGKHVKYKAHKVDGPALNQMIVDLRHKWKDVSVKSVEGQRKLEKAMLQSGQYKDALISLLQWLRKAEKELSLDCSVYGDLETVSNLLDNHKLLEHELESRHELMEFIVKTDAEMENSNKEQEKLIELQDLWGKVQELSNSRGELLKEAWKEAQSFSVAMNNIAEWINDTEMALHRMGGPPEDETMTRAQLTSVNDLRLQQNKMKNDRDKVFEQGQKIIDKAHADAATNIRNSTRDIQNQWNKLCRLLFERHQKLLFQIKFFEEFERNLEDLIKWVLGIEEKIGEDVKIDLPLDMGKTLELVEVHKQFMKNVEKRLPQIDKVCRAKPKKASPKIINRFRKKKSLPNLQIRPPRVQYLHDKWRQVWVLLWDRQRQLKEHLSYLRDKEKADKFSWDEWKRRFLKFMCYKKSRVVDLLRKMDKNNNDLISIDEFIDGIIKTKFDTNRLEMEHLVKLFDIEGKGLIDWRQFLIALRPEWEEKQTNVDDAKILTEFKKIVLMCTCKSRIQVVHVGDGRYKIGDNQKIRLVRILKSTVMVRVGGGWVTLQEFLKKNDPCRAVGRTNIELREKFLLPEGGSQALASFKSKFGTSSVTRLIHGPVTKVRERTEKSMKMSTQAKTQHFECHSTNQPHIRIANSATKPAPKLGPRQNSMILERAAGGSRPESRLGTRQNSMILESKLGPRQKSMVLDRNGSSSGPASGMGSRQGSIIFDKDSKSKIPRFKLTPMQPSDKEESQHNF